MLTAPMNEFVGGIVVSLFLKNESNGGIARSAQTGGYKQQGCGMTDSCVHHCKYSKTFYACITKSTNNVIFYIFGLYPFRGTSNVSPAGKDAAALVSVSTSTSTSLFLSKPMSERYTHIEIWISELGNYEIVSERAPVFRRESMSIGISGTGRLAARPFPEVHRQ